MKCIVLNNLRFINISLSIHYIPSQEAIAKSRVRCTQLFGPSVLSLHNMSIFYLPSTSFFLLLCYFIRYFQLCKFFLLKLFFCFSLIAFMLLFYSFTSLTSSTFFTEISIFQKIPYKLENKN